jgi:hypothetical protein
VRKAVDHRRVQAEIDSYLAELLRELVNLKWAMAQFGDDFDEREWIACFESEDPAQQARRSTVLWPFANAFNCLNELLRRASWIKLGYQPIPSYDMNSVFTKLRQDGAMNGATQKVLARLNSHGRNAMTHRYPDMDPAELRQTIIEFDRIQPQLRATLDTWLGRKGYRLLP